MCRTLNLIGLTLLLILQPATASAQFCYSPPPKQPTVQKYLKQIWPGTRLQINLKGGKKITARFCWAGENQFTVLQKNKEIAFDFSEVEKVEVKRSLGEKFKDELDCWGTAFGFLLYVLAGGKFPAA